MTRESAPMVRPVCPKCEHPMVASRMVRSGGTNDITWSCTACNETLQTSSSSWPSLRGAPVDQSSRHPWHRTLCYRVLVDFRQCDAAAFADVAVANLTDAEQRALELQLATILRCLRVSRDSAETALGRELGAVLVELGRTAVGGARERVGDAVLQVLPLTDAPELLSACLDVLSDVGIAASMALESVSAVVAGDIDAARPQ